MKNSSPLRILVAATVLCAASLATSSCSSHYPSPQMAATTMAQSTGKVFSYNDQAVPSARAVDEVGPLPARTARSIEAWLKNSVVKSVSYAYPQYFIEMIDNKSGKAKVWALISDGRGNLVGIYIPKGNTPAWAVPNTADYKLYVCEGYQRDGLNRAIMTSLFEAGYDEPRINARKAVGLTEERYLVSKPSNVVAPVASVSTEEKSDDSAKAEQSDAPAEEASSMADDDPFASDDSSSSDDDPFADDSSDSDDSDADDSGDDFADDDFGDDDFGL